ncbi:MAG TPA: Gldg family protein [Candidatus Acidoferrales bacterium]|nr:Gldg family protein [Candidatus Acidoferrales bacterium]
MKRNLQTTGEVTLSLGAALLVAGYLRYSIQGDLERLSEVLLIAGGVMFLAGLGMCYRGIIRFFSKRSSQLGTNTMILSVSILAILVVANYLGYQYHKRFDLTTEKLFTLSDQTKKIVGGLKTDVNVARFAKSPDTTYDELLPEYHSLSSHLKFQTVDPQQKPDVAKDYGATQMGDVIVSSGDKKQTVQGAAEGNLTEENLTSAILKVTQSEVKTACFITGHGEKSTADTGAHGYSTVSDGLKKEGYASKDVNLVQSNGVPSDCSLVVIAGPTKPFFPQEEQIVSKYIGSGGKALIMVDPQTDPQLNDIFTAWNINVGNNVVIDASGIGRLLGAGPAIPLVADYGDSPITKTLERQMTFFPLARTVSLADKSKTDPQAVELLKTSAQSFTTPKLASQVKYDSKTDQLGPLSLGVAASGLGSDLKARLVVIGNSDFASNSGVNGPGDNSDLFYNTIDWLAQQENQISIRPKEPTDRHITMTEAQKSALTWLDIFLIPGLIVFSGISIWWRRR